MARMLKGFFQLLQKLITIILCFLFKALTQKLKEVLSKTEWEIKRKSVPNPN